VYRFAFLNQLFVFQTGHRLFISAVFAESMVAINYVLYLLLAICNVVTMFW